MLFVAVHSAALGYSKLLTVVVSNYRTGTRSAAVHDHSGHEPADHAAGHQALHQSPESPSTTDDRGGPAHGRSVPEADIKPRVVD
jgi:hypothetical protein